MVSPLIIQSKAGNREQLDTATILELAEGGLKPGLQGMPDPATDTMQKCRGRGLGAVWLLASRSRSKAGHVDSGRKILGFQPSLCLTKPSSFDAVETKVTELDVLPKRKRRKPYQTNFRTIIPAVSIGSRQTMESATGWHKLWHNAN